MLSNFLLNRLIPSSDDNLRSNSLYTGLIAGTRHYDLKNIYHHIHKGSRLWLRPENDNPFDERAVKVMFKDFVIGYIPKSDTAAVRHLIEQGKSLAKVSNVWRSKYLPTEKLELILE